MIKTTSFSNAEKLEIAMEAAGMAWWWMELPSGAIFFSENKTRMIGRDKEKFHHYSHFTKLVHPDDYEPMMQAMYDHLSGEKLAYETYYRIKSADGSYRTFYDKGQMVSEQGGERVIAGIVMGVSDDKTSPKALREELED